MLPSISTLQREQMKKEVKKDSIYKIVLKTCGQKIIEANKKSKNSYCFFEVPTIIIGHSDYNVIDCTKYLMGELIKENYVVEFLQPNYLYIDWGKPVSHPHNLTPGWVENKKKFEKETKRYMKKYPNAEIEIVYDKKNK